MIWVFQQCATIMIQREIQIIVQFLQLPKFIIQTQYTKIMTESKSTEFAQLCIKQKYQIQSLLSNDSLTLRIRARTHTNRKSIYEHKFNNIHQIDREKILYDSFEDIVNYIRNPNHLIVEEDGHEKLFVKVVEKNNRSNVVLQFCVEFLEEVDVESDELPIRAIYNVCENKKDFSGGQLKELLLMVTMGLEKLDRKLQSFENNVAYKDPSRLGLSTPRKKEGNFILDEQADQIKMKEEEKGSNYEPAINSARSIANNAELEDVKKRISELEMKLYLNKELPTKLSEINAKIQKTQESNQKIEKKIDTKVNIAQTEAMIKKQWKIVQEELMKNLPKVLSDKINEVFKLEEVSSKIKKMERCIEELSSNNNSAKKFDKEKVDKIKLSGEYIAREPSKWVDDKSNQYKRLQIKNNVVFAKSAVNVFGKERLEPNGVTSFCIYIANMKEYIGIGIANAKYKNESQMGPDLIKYGSNGYLFDGKTEKPKVGKEFKENEYVTVIIDFQQGTITWKVKDESRHKESYDKLKTLKTEWCPYILMFSADDAVVGCERRDK